MLFNYHRRSRTWKAICRPLLDYFYHGLLSAC